MYYLFKWYGMLFGFMGNHPFFCFFTFPLWAILVLVPLFVLAATVDTIVDAVKFIFKKR